MLDPQRIHALRELDVVFHEMDTLEPDPRDVLRLVVAVEHVLRAFVGYRPTIEHDDGKEVG
jgi:hypothetical protein